MKKMLLAFGLLGLSLASAKTYNVTVNNAAIGNGQLNSGEYKLEIKGDRVLLSHGKMVSELPVQVENAPRKFDNTSVSYFTENGTARIREIRLGGTTLKLLFTN